MRNRKLGFVFQFHHLLREFTALENVMLPLLIAGEDESRARSRAEELLAAVGLAGRMTHRPSALSGGEQQRTAVARALAADPLVILADEPSGNLDNANSERLHGLFGRLAREFETALVVVTHNRAPRRPGRPGAVAGGRPPDPALRRGVDALMSCDQCREREAVIHLTQIVNDQVTTLHLCERCAAEKGVESPGVGRQDAAGQLPRGHGQGGRDTGAAHAPIPAPAAADPSRTSGRAGASGCPECWRAFEAPLRDLLRRLHGSTHHVGERYADRHGAAGEPQIEAADLRERLRVAVESENFELAAELRDRLRVLE